MRAGYAELVGLGGLGLFLGMLVRAIVMRVRVEGPSMEPALRDGDRVLVDSLTYHLRPPERGEVVLARVPSVPGGMVIKRVVALSGDGVCPAASGETCDCGGGVVISHVDANHYYLVGDNRGESVDSRRFGPVERRRIVGRVWYRYWPPARRGKLTHGWSRTP